MARLYVFWNTKKRPRPWEAITYWMGRQRRTGPPFTPVRPGETPTPDVIAIGEPCSWDQIRGYFGDNEVQLLNENEDADPHGGYAFFRREIFCGGATAGELEHLWVFWSAASGLEVTALADVNITMRNACGSGRFPVAVDVSDGMFSDKVAFWHAPSPENAGAVYGRLTDFCRRAGPGAQGNWQIELILGDFNTIRADGFGSFELMSPESGTGSLTSLNNQGNMSSAYDKVLASQRWAMRDKNHPDRPGVRAGRWIGIPPVDASDVQRDMYRLGSTLSPYQYVTAWSDHLPVYADYPFHLGP